MEVSIQFWVPNLGLSPKYDYVTFRNENLQLATIKLNFGKKILPKRIKYIAKQYNTAKQ